MRRSSLWVVILSCFVAGYTAIRREDAGNELSAASMTMPTLVEHKEDNSTLPIGPQNFSDASYSYNLSLREGNCSCIKTEVAENCTIEANGTSSCSSLTVSRCNCTHNCQNQPEGPPVCQNIEVNITSQCNCTERNKTKCEEVGDGNLHCHNKTSSRCNCSQVLTMQNGTVIHSVAKLDNVTKCNCNCTSPGNCPREACICENEHHVEELEVHHDNAPAVGHTQQITTESHKTEVIHPEEGHSEETPSEESALVHQAPGLEPIGGLEPTVPTKPSELSKASCRYFSDEEANCSCCPEHLSVNCTTAENGDETCNNSFIGQCNCSSCQAQPSGPANCSQTTINITDNCTCREEFYRAFSNNVSSKITNNTCNCNATLTLSNGTNQTYTIIRYEVHNCSANCTAEKVCGKRTCVKYKNESIILNGAQNQSNQTSNVTVNETANASLIQMESRSGFQVKLLESILDDAQAANLLQRAALKSASKKGTVTVGLSNATNNLTNTTQTNTTQTNTTSSTVNSTSGNDTQTNSTGSSNVTANSTTTNTTQTNSTNVTNNTNSINNTVNSTSVNDTQANSTNSANNTANKTSQINATNSSGNNSDVNTGTLYIHFSKTLSLLDWIQSGALALQFD